MGQEANSGRHAELDDKKERAAGRGQHDPAREAVRDANEPIPAKGQTGGAFGSEGKADRRDGGRSPAPAKDQHGTTGAKRG